MAAPSRDLHGPAQSRAVRDILQGLFAAELVHPSPKLWLFFAWIADIELLDNGARQFSAIEPDWPAAQIRLSRVLEALLKRNVNLRLIIREHGYNNVFVSRLKELKDRHGDRLKWIVQRDFHAKGLLGSDYFLSGSMNLTPSGITVNGEHLVLRCDPAIVAEQSVQLEAQWGGQVR